MNKDLPYAAVDRAILDHIRCNKGHPRNSNEVQGEARKALAATGNPNGSYYYFVDRRLQNLRKSGQVAFCPPPKGGAKRWVVVDAQPQLSHTPSAPEPAVRPSAPVEATTPKVSDPDPVAGPQATPRQVSGSISPARKVMQSRVAPTLARSRHSIARKVDLSTLDGRMLHRAIELEKTALREYGVRLSYAEVTRRTWPD